MSIRFVIDIFDTSADTNIDIFDTIIDVFDTNTDVFDTYTDTSR
mgnify:FL=1